MLITPFLMLFYFLVVRVVSAGLLRLSNAIRRLARIETTRPVKSNEAKWLDLVIISAIAILAFAICLATENTLIAPLGLAGINAPVWGQIFGMQNTVNFVFVVAPYLEIWGAPAKTKA